MMKNSLCLLTILTTWACASATVRVFVTKSSDPYGLENNANHAIPTVSAVYVNGVDENGYDYWADYEGTIPGPIRPGGFPPADAPSGDPNNPIIIPPGDFAYMWLQFQSEPNSAKINGLGITIHVAGVPYDPNDPNSQPALAPTYYLCNNMNNEVAMKRWDGTATPPGYPEWHKNPERMIAVNTYGLQNRYADLGWNLWKGGTVRIALLGAVENDLSGKTYEIQIPLIGYASGSPNGLASGFFTFVPEPAAVLLMTAASLFMRGRRS